MKAEAVQKLKNGVYRIHWSKSHGNGTSVASIGRCCNGDVWLAAANWTVNSEGEDKSVRVAAFGQRIWYHVLKVELITER